jgi:hypothetical protein
LKNNDIKEALARLEMLSQEENRMAGAQALKVMVEVKASVVHGTQSHANSHSLLAENFLIGPMSNN